MLTAAGAVAVNAPRVNDRRIDADTGERQGFSSAILPLPPSDWAVAYESEQWWVTTTLVSRGSLRCSNAVSRWRAWNWMTMEGLTRPT